MALSLWPAAATGGENELLQQLQQPHRLSTKKRRAASKALVPVAGLQPSPLIGVVREGWSLAWHVMMQQLAPSSKAGAYQRPQSQFRRRFPGPVPASQSGRYHLYVSLVCPWAHRAVIVHSLKGLAQAVPLSLAVPGSSGFWEFDPRVGRDMAHNCRRLVDVYGLTTGGYGGRATVPMLWDSVNREVINNESADIIHILNSDFNELADNPELDLAPPHLTHQIGRWNELTYSNVNNGVYRCGFAQGQDAYTDAVEGLFSSLQVIEEELSRSRFLCGDCLTLADIRLFTTLVRFDAVYHILFKCSKQKLSEYPNLYAYLREIYQIPGVSSTCDLQAIMDGYYKVLFPLNPGGIQPAIPNSVNASALSSSHGRERLHKRAS